MLKILCLVLCVLVFDFPENNGEFVVLDSRFLRA